MVFHDNYKGRSFLDSHNQGENNAHSFNRKRRAAEASRAERPRGLYRGVGHRVIEARAPAIRGNTSIQSSETAKLGEMQGTSRETIGKKNRAKYVVADLPASGVESPATCAGLFLWSWTFLSTCANVFL